MSAPGRRLNSRISRQSLTPKRDNVLTAALNAWFWGAAGTAHEVWAAAIAAAVTTAQVMAQRAASAAAAGQSVLSTAVMAVRGVLSAAAGSAIVSTVASAVRAAMAATMASAAASAVGSLWHAAAGVAAGIGLAALRLIEMLAPVSTVRRYRVAFERRRVIVR